MFFAQDKRPFRELLHQAIGVSEQMLVLETQLIEILKKIDQRNWYKWYGFKTLTKFCTFALKLSRTQAQRIVTRVRRLEDERSEENLVHRRSGESASRVEKNT